MNARAWTSSVLVVLATGATAYAYFVDRGTVSDADRAARRSDVFPSFRVEDVRRIELRHGPELLVLERDADDATRWHLASPRRAAADAGAVDALLRELELAKRLRDVPPQDAIGLDAPRVQGKLSFGRYEYAFALGGDATRPQGAAYMRLDGEGAFVVDRSLAVQLLRGSDTYRERALVSIPASEIEQLDVVSPGGRLSLARSGATFRVGGASGLRASRTAVEGLFAALADARIETFLDDAEADRLLGAGTPTTTVVVTPRQGREPCRLRAGGDCPGQPSDVVVTRDAPDRASGCIPRTVAEALEGNPAAMVDRSLFYAHGDEIEEVRLAGQDGAVEIARRGGGWHERAPVDRELKPDEVDSATALVSDLAGARALEVIPSSNGYPPLVTGTASIIRTGTGTRESIEIGSPREDGTAWARRLDDGAFLRLARDVVRRSQPHPVALRAKQVWQAPFDPAAVQSIDDTCTPGREHLEMQGGRWSFREPHDLPVDSAAAIALTDALAHAEAAAWIAESDDGAFGFGRPGSCAVTLGLSPGPEEAGGAASVGIVFGRAAPGGTYAHTLGERAVFVAPAELRSTVARPPIGAARLLIDPTALAHAVLIRGDARVTLDGTGERLVRRRAAGAEDDAGDDRLGAAVAGFHARAALHPGAPSSDEGFDRPTLEIETVSRGDAPRTRTTIVVGAATRPGGGDYFARASGIDATFAVPRECVDAIVAAW